MVYNPYQQKRQGQPVLYGPTGEIIRYAEEAPEEEAPVEEGSFEELFTAQVEAAATLSEAESKAIEEGRKRTAAAKEEEERQRVKVRERELAKSTYELKMAQQKQALGRTGETKWGGFTRSVGRAQQVARGTSKVAGAAYKIGTLGGPVKRPMKEVRELYIPSARRMGASPGEGPQQISPSEIGAPLRQLSVIPLDTMRQRTSPGGLGSMLIAQVARSTVMGAQPMGGPRVASESALARLRGLTFPRGLSEQERAAYQEIRQNHDIDIPTHVIDELAKLGIPSEEAIRAIKGLIKKGHIRRSGEFSGEPVLEVTR